MRGEADFSAARLRRQIGPWSLADTDHPPDELEAYRRFYGFSVDADHRIGTIESRGQSIVVQSFAPSAPVATAVVVHGYYDHVGLFVFLIEHLLRRNIAVVSCDLPGHGLSSGDRVTIDSFDTYVAVVRDVISVTAGVDATRYPQPMHLVGQSMGGSIAMEMIEQGGTGDFQSVTLLAPLIYPWNWRVSRWVYRLVRHFIASRPRAPANPQDQPEFQALRAVDPLQAGILPVSWVTAMVNWAVRFEEYPDRREFSPFIVQGHADRVVDWPYNLDVLRRRYTPRVLELEEATHHLVNESPAIQARMWCWLDAEIGWGRAPGEKRT